MRQKDTRVYGTQGSTAPEHRSKLGREEMESPLAPEMFREMMRLAFASEDFRDMVKHIHSSIGTEPPTDVPNTSTEVLKDRDTLEEVLANLKEYCECSEDDVTDDTAPYEGVATRRRGVFVFTRDVNAAPVWFAAGRWPLSWRWCAIGRTRIL